MFHGNALSGDEINVVVPHSAVRFFVVEDTGYVGRVVFCRCGCGGALGGPGLGGQGKIVGLR